MKIVYYFIPCPSHYGVSYVNDNLNYAPPDHKLVNLFGNFTGAVSKSTCEITLSIPVNDGGAGGFDYTLQVANMFDNMVTDNNLYKLSFE